MAQDLFAQDAWTRARDRFMEDLTEPERVAYHQSSLEMIYYDASATQNRHQDASTSRHLMAKLQPLTSAIEQYGEALDVYVSAYPLALSPLWGSLRIVLLVGSALPSETVQDLICTQLAREFSKYFEKLVDMFERIGDILPRFRAYERLFPDNERLLHTLSVIYVDILRFCHDTKAVFRRSKHPSGTIYFKPHRIVTRLLTALLTPVVNLRISLKMTWKPFDRQFGEHLRKFREHRKSVEKEAELSHMIESADTKALIIANQMQVQKEKREDDRNRMLSQLSAVSQDDLHKMQRHSYCPGTGLWALQTSEYLEWKALRGPGGLCCYGIPGCGKSILVSTIIEDLFLVEKQSGKLLVYFYCSFADPRSLVKSQILGNLLRQLIHKGAVSQKAEKELIDSFVRDGRSPDDEKLVQELRSAAGRSGGLYIVFDGLDECKAETFRTVADLLIELTDDTSLGVRVLLTCRQQSHTMGLIHDWPQIRLDERSCMDDIQAFVASSVRARIEEGEMKISTPSLEHEVVTTLVKKSHGMFLWIHFQLIALCSAMSSAQVRATLQNLPDGLERTYERILYGISMSSTKARVAERVFKWLACARRPLCVGELQEAVAFDESDKAWDSEKIPDPDLLLQSCQGLVIRNQDNSTVRFAHYTVQQYLIVSPSHEPQRMHLGIYSSRSEFPSSSNTLPFQFRMQDAEADVAQLCVTYLNFTDFETTIALRPSEIRFDHGGIFGPGGAGSIASTLGIGKPIVDVIHRVLGGRARSTALNIDFGRYLNIKPTAQTSAVTKKHVLLDYIINNWPWHVDGCGIHPLENDALVDLVYNRTLPFEFRPWGPNRHYGPYGCSSCWTDTNEPVHPRNLVMTSMMHWAAEQGLLSLILLVGTFGLGPLHFESNFPFKPVRGLKHFVHERYSHESMLIACRNGQTNVLKYLADIETKFDTEQTDRSCSNLCMAACASGHVETLETLFDLGRVGSIEVVRRSLFGAATNGYAEVVRVLLIRGRSEIDREGGEGGKADDADMPLRGNFFEEHDEQTGLTALHSAAANGHEVVVKFLSGVYSDIDIADQISGSTALHCAASHGHAQVVQLLLSLGASVQSRDKNKMTPLLLAAQYGCLTVVRCLLECGASADDLGGDILRKDKTFAGASSPPASSSASKIASSLSPLMWAAARGHTEVVDLLLKVDKKIHRSTRSGFTPVLLAAFYGHIETLKKLFDRGAENSRTIDGWNGIHLAAQNGHNHCVEFLASHGTSLDALTNVDDGARTALHVAIEANQTSTIIALGRLGAELKIMNAANQTAYEMTKAGQDATRRALIEAEAAQIGRPPLWRLRDQALRSNVSLDRETTEIPWFLELQSWLDTSSLEEKDQKYISTFMLDKLYLHGWLSTAWRRGAKPPSMVVLV